jgi:hypothetical protein
LGFHIALNDDDGTLPAPKTQLGWSGRAHEEYTYGHLTLSASSGPPPGGNLTVNSIKVSGNNLELSITTPNASGTHAVQQTGDIAKPQWSDVAGFTFSSPQGDKIVATFPKPSNSPTFYRVTVR